MFNTNIICRYITPFDTINLCSTCKKLYEKIDEHMLETNSTNDFAIIKENGHYENTNEKYVLGIGQITMFLDVFDFFGTTRKFKNIEFIVNSKVSLENTVLEFEDCVFISEKRSAFIDVNNSSEISFSFCYVKNFSLFCKIYDSETNFENTIFENVLVPILGRRSYSNIFDTKFINCNMPINYFENFRLVVRDSIFLGNCKFSIFIQSDNERNHLEIGNCSFDNCILPKLYISNENTVDIY